MKITNIIYSSKNRHTNNTTMLYYDIYIFDGIELSN